MAGKARITSDFPTTEEVASRLKVPPARVAELLKQLHGIHAKNGNVTFVEFKKATGRTKAGARRKGEKVSRSHAPAKKR